MFLTRVRLQGLGYTECFSGQGFGWFTHQSRWGGFKRMAVVHNTFQFVQACLSPREAGGDFHVCLGPERSAACSAPLTAFLHKSVLQCWPPGLQGNRGSSSPAPWRALNHHHPPAIPQLPGGGGSPRVPGHRSTLPWTHGTPSPRAESCMPGPPHEFIPGQATRTTVFLTSAGNSCWLADAPF